jgi:cell division protein FtsL
MKWYHPCRPWPSVLASNLGLNRFVEIEMYSPDTRQSATSHFKTIFFVIVTTINFVVLMISLWTLAHQTKREVELAAEVHALKSDARVLQDQLASLSKSVAVLAQARASAVQLNDVIIKHIADTNKEIERLSSEQRRLATNVPSNQADLPTSLLPGPTVSDFPVLASSKPAIAKAPIHPLAIKFNSLPKNLWPEADQQAIKITSRNKWVQENVKVPLGPWVFAGTIRRVSTTMVTGKVAREERVLVELDIPPMNIWDVDTTFSTMAILDNVKVSDAVDWKPGKEIILTATVESISYESPTLMLRGSLKAENKPSTTAK